MTPTPAESENLSQAATDRFGAFIRAASALLKKHDSVAAQHMSRTLEGAVLSPVHTAPSPTPIDLTEFQTIAQPRDDLAAALAACAGDLHWRQAGFGKIPPKDAHKLAVCEVVGPEGMFRLPQIRFGLLVQREGFHYPKHSHAAEELYFVLDGTGCWGKDNDEPTMRPPGTFIHHLSRQPHTMITRTEPMLTLWGWTGDVDGNSYTI